MSVKRLTKTGLLFLLSVVLITPLLSAYARFSAQQSVSESLATQLPTAIEAALVNSHNRQDSFRLSADRLVQAMGEFEFMNTTRLPIVQRASIKQFVLHDAEDSPPVTPDLHQQIRWQQGSRSLIASYQLGLVYNRANLLIQSVLIALISLVTVKLVPSARRHAKSDWLTTLKTYHFDQTEAKLISEITENTAFFNHLLQRVREETSLDITQIAQLIASDNIEALEGKTLSWFITAIKRGLSIDESLAVAAQDHSLSFALARQELTIHGLTIPFPKTPLFYYFWYAKRKVDKLGPFLNPAHGKPDPVAGAELSAIMEANNGHLKAIHDLEDAGLKGKTLDQNRNKIKDELTQLLGDELAEPYLFSSERDPKTARYLYELVLPTALIRV